MSTEDIVAAKRLGVKKFVGITNWYVGWSPRNDSDCAEGTWDDWVKLAHLILERDKERKLVQ